jgi:signal transduction histidine kinase
VDLLFATFIIIQVNYLFGGQSNIHADGFTYADYARKGFFELLVVAVISLLLIQILSAITKRKDGRQAGIFSGLNIGLVALVVMILVSAFQRLLMYKAAYGFTRVRIYSENFMVWMAILLLATALLEFIRRERLFSLAVLVCAIGFGVTINLTNVDATIARENVTRAVGGNKLDIDYLATLSEDSIPYLADVYSTNPAQNSGIGAVLACRNARINPPEDATTPPMPAQGWMSYNVSRQAAWARMATLDSELKSAYPLRHDQDTQWDYVMYGAERLDCGWFGYWD